MLMVLSFDRASLIKSLESRGCDAAGALDIFTKNPEDWQELFIRF
jgi:hypothetical protein